MCDAEFQVAGSMVERKAEYERQHLGCDHGHLVATICDDCFEDVVGAIAKTKLDAMAEPPMGGPPG